MVGGDRSEAATADPNTRRARPRHGGASPHRPRHNQLLLARSHLQRERALPGLGEHLRRVEPVPDLAGEPEPIETACGEDDRIQAALATLAQARVDVPAQRLDGQRRLEREELRTAADGRGADPHPRPDSGRAAQRVARILPLEVGADDEPFGIGGGHVLGGVDSDVDTPSSNDSSISLTKTPRAPISPNGLVRSRSPAVVIGTSAISIPGRRRREAASSAWTSASLLPREPILTSIVLEPEQVADDVRVHTALGACRGFLHAHRRQVQELAHDLGSERLHRAAVLLGQPAQPRPGELAGANLFRPRAQGRDRRDDVQRGLPRTKPLGLVGNDLLRARRFRPPARETLRDDGLQVVDVVQVATGSS